MPMHGVSLAYTYDAPEAPTRRETQYFEMVGHRAIWHDGWKAVTFHRKGENWDEDGWELYHLDRDFSEFEDRAASDPEKLKELVDRWWDEAAKYDVLPLDDRSRERENEPQWMPERTSYVYYPGIARVLTGGAPKIMHRSYQITAEIDRADTSAEGVLIAHGGQNGGYALYIQNNRLVHHYNSVGTHYQLVSERELPAGPLTVKFVFTKTGHLQGTGALFVNEEKVAEGPLPKTIPNRISDEGLDIGRDGLTPVSPDYRCPFAFTGMLKQVRVDLGDDRSREIGGTPSADHGNR
jgi:arylsulfatase